MPAYGQVQDDFGGDPMESLTAREKQLAAKRLFLMKKASEAAAISSPGGQTTPRIEGQPQWYIPPSFLQMAQPLIGQGVNLAQRRALEKEQQAYDADEKSAASAVMNSMPAPRTETRRMANPPGEPEGYLETTETKQPTREEKMAWASKGMQVPSLRKQLEKFYDDQLVNEPVRQEAREDKRLDREDRQAATSEAQRARREDATLRQTLEMKFKEAELAQKAEAARQRSEDMRYGIDERRAASREHNALMGQIASMKAGAAETKANAAASTKATDAKNVLELLNEAEPLISGATSSVIGYGRDLALSGIGQSTEAGDKSAKLKSIQGFLVSKMPKMSGPQSDKDVLLYREMAGKLGDPMVPSSQKQAALDTIRSLHQRYAGETAPAARPPTINDEASYNRLPRGASYIDGRDGSTKVKK